MICKVYAKYVDEKEKCPDYVRVSWPLESNPDPTILSGPPDYVLNAGDICKLPGVKPNSGKKETIDTYYNDQLLHLYKIDSSYSVETDLETKQFEDINLDHLEDIEILSFEGMLRNEILERFPDTEIFKLKPSNF